MHVVSFYSYKGGVGRTMALVNVAALLAKAGRRVLVVDFDLEAPGVPSYFGLNAARGRPGIVDYIHEYLEKQAAPDASRYIVECTVDDAASIWVMPAGDNSRPEYSDRFASIDWGYLYECQSGYDLLEDLKQQWAVHEAQFDYVLIDSRTGNTDIAGICTRQLPDSVVILFVPTQQNIDGLAPIVRQIRKDATEFNRDISLLFCPSNIPDLFDEEDILGKSLKDAADRLGYGNPATLEPPVSHIHHWANMELLEQPLVVLKRGQSKLAKEYEGLKTAIISQNPTDREGALAALDRMPDIYEAARRATRGQAATQIIERTSEIARLHDGDGEIAFKAAHVFSVAGDYEQEERSLSDAIQAKVTPARAQLFRAVARINLNKKDEALEDLRNVLASPDGTIFEFRPAVQLLRAVVDDPISEGRAIFAQSGTRLRAKIALSHLLMQDRANHSFVADSLLAAIDKDNMSSEQIKNATNAAMLALIGAGRFGEALEIGNCGDSAENIADFFNTTMATWGLSGEVPVDMFSRLNDELSSDDGDQNMHQCIALVRGVVGRGEDAIREIQKSEERITPSGYAFSCWTFSQRSANEFREDLRDMREMIEKGDTLNPPFLRRHD